MPVFCPEDIRAWTDGSWNHRDFRSSVSGFSQDTRRLNPGEMFVALRTENRDGHDFLDAAKERGASAALVEHWVESSDLPQLKVSHCGEAFLRMGRGHRNLKIGSKPFRLERRKWRFCVVQKIASARAKMPDVA